jgi:hypothetical protein
MRPRRLIAFTLLYALLAFVAVGIAMLAVGDCIQGQAGIDRCNHLAMQRRHVGFLIALGAYPFALAWLIVRRRGRRG